ncbi:MAG: hypothetical protein AB1758_13155 [Candidatus Eremiobacterota bacterium]
MTTAVMVVVTDFLVGVLCGLLLHRVSTLVVGASRPAPAWVEEERT